MRGGCQLNIARRVFERVICYSGAMQKIRIRKSGPVDAVVDVPGSKSLTNRALIVSALSGEKTRLIGASESEDSRHLVEAIAQVQKGSGAGHFSVGNAGTALRFLASYLCLHNTSSTLDGDERMRERPIQGLVDALNAMGGDVRCANENGCPPLRIRGGGLRGGKVTIDGSTSSQFVSSALMVAPYCREDVTIHVKGPIVSKSYIDMTCDVMRDFGVEIVRDGYSSFFVKAGQRYRPHGAYAIQPDIAGANYFFALAAVTGGRVTVRRIRRASSQSESGFLDVLQTMGCTVTEGKDGVTVVGGRLRGVDIDMSDMPDSAQTLACVALFAEGPTRIRGVGTLRVKETDRLRAMDAELQKLGARVDVHPDGLTVTPGTIRPAEIETYHDHRMAMSFAVAGAGIGDVVILDPACVRKSFPEFFSTLGQAGVPLESEGASQP